MAFENVSQIVTAISEQYDSVENRCQCPRKRRAREATFTKYLQLEGEIIEIRE
jgi:hypothetical protein